MAMAVQAEEGGNSVQIVWRSVQECSEHSESSGVEQPPLVTPLADLLSSRNLCRILSALVAMNAMGGLDAEPVNATYMNHVARVRCLRPASHDHAVTPSR